MFTRAGRDLVGADLSLPGVVRAILGSGKLWRAMFSLQWPARWTLRLTLFVKDARAAGVADTFESFRHRKPYAPHCTSSAVWRASRQAVRMEVRLNIMLGRSLWFRGDCRFEPASSQPGDRWPWGFVNMRYAYEYAYGMHIPTLKKEELEK